MISPKGFHCKKPVYWRTVTNIYPSTVREWILLGYKAPIPGVYTSNADNKGAGASNIVLGEASFRIAKGNALPNTEYVAK